jgi:hypothetical protein
MVNVLLLPSTFLYSFSKSKDNSLPFVFHIGYFYTQQNGASANNSDLYAKRPDSNLDGAPTLLNENFWSISSCRQTQDHNRTPPNSFEIIFHQISYLLTL